VADVLVGVWIAPRVVPFGGWVGSVAPGGYAAYAWVLYPVPTLTMRSLVHCGYRGHGDGTNYDSVVRSMPTIQVLSFQFAQLVTLRPRL